MIMIYRPPNTFGAVDTSQMQSVGRFFDANGDGQWSVREMRNASTALKYFGENFGNDKLQNMGMAFGRLADEVERGNRNVDSNGNQQLSSSELLSTARRNNANQLEEADLNRWVPPTRKTNFTAINRNTAKQVFEFADRNGDGKASVSEMKQAKSYLDNFGGYSNYSNMLQRMIEETEGGNRAVDANGDKAISYRTAGNFPPGMLGLVAPSELDQMISRNNFNKLEVADTQSNSGNSGSIGFIGSPTNINYASGVQTATNKVAKTQAEWNNLWTSAGQTPPDGFDPETEMAIGVFMGSKPTGGYSISIKSVREEDGKLVVEYEEQSPGPDQMVTQAFTSPASIVKLPKSNLPVVFQKV